MTVKGIDGDSGTFTRYTLKHSLGTSWSDSYSTCYGAGESSNCLSKDKGPMISTFHSGHGHGSGTYGVHIDECDVTHGSTDYTWYGNREPEASGHTGSAAIWLR